jgi:hypothetical protein
MIAARIMSTSVCVRVAIKHLHAQSSKKSAFVHDNGQPLDKAEEIDVLMVELGNWHETIPMNPLCGNPCQNSPNCKGFDFGKRGGCPGYEVDPQ